MEKPTESSSVRLTHTVKKGGCAAKLSVSDLRELLAPLAKSSVKFPDVIVDGSTFDDAAVLRWSKDQALVQTLDFFTPIVDSPFVFGQIASANALSDVYAMGGEPVSAMAILSFPLTSLPLSVGQEVMRGCLQILADAETPLVGGHTIDDDTLKFGLSVSGRVHENRILTNQKARPGQTLVLTKPLGTGTACAALKQGEVSEEGIAEEIRSMCTLNKFLDLLGEFESSISAATDVTGFGLLGHALNLARESAVTLQIHSANVPRFADSLKFLDRGILTKAHRTNWEATRDHVDLNGVEGPLQKLLVDPQTSGGLLLAVDSEKVDEVIFRLQKRFAKVSKIGLVVPRAHHYLQIQ